MTTIAYSMKPGAVAQRKCRSQPGQKEVEKARRNIKRENELGRQKYHTIDGWKRYTLSSLKYRAKQRGLSFDLTIEDLVFPEYCPVLGLKLEIGTGIRGLGMYACPSVDRIDNTKGYTKDNIQIISNRANILKKDGVLEEFEALVKYLKEGK